jgi:RNA polymerase sigma-54 factor
MIAEARRFIVKNLYPYPLSLIEADAGRTALLSQPDLIIRRDHRGGQIYQVEVPGCEEYQLRVNNGFAATLSAHNGGRDLSADDAAWLQVHLSEARLFIASLQQRWATLRRIGEYLTRYQADFLAHGPRHLQPLTRAAISAALGLHESTVSRAIRDKVVQMPDGHLLLLADFFDGSLAVKTALRELLTADGQTMSDRELAQALERQGLLLARRTVAKYREQLSIPISHRRRQVDASYLAL